MRPRSTASIHRPRRLGLIALLSAVSLVPAATVAAGPATPPSAPASTAPAAAGQAVLATFAGSVKGIVLLTERDGGKIRIETALTGVPGGTVRLVASPDGCEVTLPMAERALSLPFSPIRWVRTTVSGLLEEEGIWYYRSIRLVKPGSPNRQLACKQVRYLLPPSSPTAAFAVSQVLISSYAVAGGVRGMIATGPGSFDPVPLSAVILRRAAGATYRLVGSSAPCGTSHQANETVFDRTFPASGAITKGITAMDDWEAIASFRIFRGAGFSQQVRCLQDGVKAFEEIV